MPICYTELLYGVNFLNESRIAIEIMALSYKLKRRKIGENYIFQETTRVSFLISVGTQICDFRAIRALNI